jgi:hypothetical protein
VVVSCLRIWGSSSRQNGLVSINLPDGGENFVDLVQRRFRATTGEPEPVPFRVQPARFTGLGNDRRNQLDRDIESIVAELSNYVNSSCSLETSKEQLPQDGQNDPLPDRPE